MGDFFDQIPGDVQDQIRDITKSSGLPDNEDSIEMMAQAWIEKKEAFEEKIEALDMEELDSYDKEDTRGALVLTYSGSLVSIGPLADDGRAVEYTSIGIRSDVPDSLKGEGSMLGKDVMVGEEMEFESGPVKSTSSIFKIAVFKEEISAEEQEEKLSDATVVLSDEFTKINKTIISNND
ncbi:MAG: hypothetical protein SVZ03_07640 [Spirochaetota bacterium]|nr:hypothetical protein [Spirochaetota bacterium]